MVRTRYLRSWTSGFEVAEVLGEGYRVRRLSDNSLLGGTFAFEEVLAVSVGPEIFASCGVEGLAQIP
jgi:hypothetical protein